MAAVVEDLEKQFQAAVEKVKTGTPKTPATNEDKLNIYKLFKQATSGDVTGSQPYAVQFEKRAKWDAHNSVKGMSKEDAMKAYIAEVERQLA
mmetsp:Transcript_12989/g.23066  ORF Transcript_12989/g.23066 Transcript_12989/m.23066 type:complete len:92 (+) Transcript_12989:100-375(+)